MDITSLQNPRVKHIVKLREDKKQRQEDGLMLVEGYDEIQLAVSAGYKPQTLLTAPELASNQLAFSAAETLTVSRPVFSAAISSTLWTQTLGLSARAAAVLRSP